MYTCNLTLVCSLNINAVFNYNMQFFLMWSLSVCLFFVLSQFPFVLQFFYVSIRLTSYNISTFCSFVFRCNTLEFSFDICLLLLFLYFHLKGWLSHIHIYFHFCYNKNGTVETRVTSKCLPTSNFTLVLNIPIQKVMFTFGHLSTNGVIYPIL